MNEEQLTARQVEAFAILEKELAAEIKYEQHNARAAFLNSSKRQPERMFRGRRRDRRLD